jgi:hypothetical protein
MQILADSDLQHHFFLHANKGLGEKYDKEGIDLRSERKKEEIGKIKKIGKKKGKYTQGVNNGIHIG